MNPEDRMRDLMRGADGTERPSEAEWDAFVGRAHRSLVMHRALSVAAVVVVLALGAIGGRAILDATRVENDLPPVEQPGETDPPGFTPTPTRTSTPDPVETEGNPITDTTVVQTWFVQTDDLSGEPELALEYAEVEDTAAIGRAALEAVLTGPSATAQANGITTTIPAGTQLLDLEIANLTATVDLSEEFTRSQLGSSADGIQVSQIVATLLQFPTVQEVQFMIEGQPVGQISGHIVLEGPVGRKYVEDDLPQIVVIRPYPGQEVSSDGFAVQGSANVFEATVSWRLLDEAGREIESGFVTAACGSGCHGKFGFMVEPGEGIPGSEVTLEVFESSAEDGRPLHTVTIPLQVG